MSQPSFSALFNESLSSALLVIQWGSARETFSLDDMKEVRMPLPSIDVQKSIVGIYEAYTIRKEINEKLKAQIKDICPILIKGSIEEATKAKEA